MTSRTRLFLYALRVSLALGCSTPKPDDTPRGPCPLGDATTPVKMTLLARTESGGLAELHDGDKIALIEPPQGGQVVFVGVRATNVDGCGVTVTATLRDKDTGLALGVDARPLDLARAADGWGETGSPDDISTFANVPVCPNRDAPRDLDGQPYTLDVTLRDRNARTATTTIAVVPSCVDPSICPCECRAGGACSQP